MVQFNFTFDPNISLEQRVGFEMAAMIWSSYLTDDVVINLHIASSDSLGENGEAVGGAIPIFHEQNYGIYQEYAEADASSTTDEAALSSLQTGNTVDFLVGNQVVDGNSDILLTSAQAKALGMDEALVLDSGNTWDRDLVDPNALDGYIIINNSFDWSYDYTRSSKAPNKTLDFLSMALHEIGHQLGFVSSLDGTLDIETLHSGEVEAEGFTALDLFRHSIDSTEVTNPDGAVADLTLGQNSYFSVDGGQTNLGDFSDGLDYQASHWNRLKVAMGVMDPTLAYRERLSINYLDLQAMDALGWDINYAALETELDLDALLEQAENNVEASLGLTETALNDTRGGGDYGDLYTLGYSQWWAIFEKHVLELGYSQWWSIFELGYSQWWQQYEEGTLELGYSQWWQAFEDMVLDLGYSQWWQEFEADMLELGYSQWWQLLELGYSQWWQQLETFFSTLDTVEGHATEQSSLIAGGGVGGQETEIFYGGENDDIIAGDDKQDRINAGAGDDLVDGKGGHDVIWGEAGRDLIYGYDGNDLIYGGDDDDLLIGEAGEDELHGEAGHDILSGGEGHDILRGGGGRDDLKGGFGRDVLSGGAGEDRLEGEADNDIVIGGEGRDQVNGGGGSDLLYGDNYMGEETLNQLRTLLKQQPIDKDAEPVATETESSANGPIRIEVESMTLSGDYHIATSYGKASDEQLVRATGGAETSYEASTVFTGETGSYMVVVRYIDESDGTAQAGFILNGEPVEQWTLDRNHDTFVTRTLATNLTLTTGDTLTLTGMSQGGEMAGLDYIELIPLDNLLVTNLDAESTLSTTNNTDSTASVENTSEPTVLRVEAESMTLTGDYQINSSSNVSDGQLVRINNNGTYLAHTNFTGEAGFYNIVVGYYDESVGGIAQMSTALNDVALDTWALDQNWSEQAVSFNAVSDFTTRQVATGVMLNPGDIFELQGTKGNNLNGTEGEEDARFDYVEFIKVDAPVLDTQPISTLIEPAPMVEDFVAHWTFDETSGTLATDRTGAHNGTLVNTVTNDSQWRTGTVGGALTLDGINDYVAVADSSEINTSAHSQRTISLWFKADDISISDRKQVIYEEGGATKGLNIYIHDGQLYVGLWDNNHGSEWNATFLSTDDITSGQWHHVALVLDGDTNLSSNAFKGYLDGELFSVGTGIELQKHGGNIAFGAIDDGTYFHDGGVNGSTGFHAFAGSIDEAYIYNQALTADEIGTLIGRDNDLIQGGAGNDIAFGGGGNDVIYGETQQDNASAGLTGSQSYNGHTYLLSTAGTWEEAQAEAHRLGGNLVTINDAAEEAWLHHTFSEAGELWIGLTDKAVEGQFEWVNGEAVTYTNWSPNEPNDYGSGEDYGIFNRAGTQQWDDRGQPGQVYQGIIEINTTDHDTLFGDSGNDTIYGQAGNDTLYGDTLAASLSEGLVAHWTFDEGSGNSMIDTAGQAADTGFRWGSVTWIEDAQRGTVMQFDGENGGIAVSDSSDLDITHQLTLSTWIKADQFRDNTGLISKGTSTQAYGIQLWGDGTIVFSANQDLRREGSGTWHSETQLSLDTWHHVAVTYDGEAIRFYIDGQLDSNVVYVDLEFASNNETFFMGDDLPSTVNVLDGALDDVRIYNRAIGAVETVTLATSDENSGSALNVAQETIYHNGSYYLLTSEDLTWEEAQAQAQSIGGNLVTINDAAEEDWLQQTFGTSEGLWIGINDRETPSQFQWASGEAVTYTNWAPNEPTGSTVQHYGYMNYGTDNLWDDNYETAQMQGIIEIKGSQQDSLIGGVGNDMLIGGLGDDVLQGTDSAGAGTLETDTMLGGAGADRFILGDAIQAYYQSQGDQDYALIKDFSSIDGDSLQLHGSAGNYTQQQQGSDLYLYYQGGSSDLVAIFENTSTLDLNAVAVFQ